MAAGTVGPYTIVLPLLETHECMSIGLAGVCYVEKSWVGLADVGYFGCITGMCVPVWCLMFLDVRYPQR